MDDEKELEGEHFPMDDEMLDEPLDLDLGGDEEDPDKDH